MKKINFEKLHEIKGGSYWGAFCTTMVVGSLAAVAVSLAPAAVVGATASAAAGGAGYAATITGGITYFTGLCGD